MLIVLLGIYTVTLVAGIHYYESKIKIWANDYTLLEKEYWDLYRDYLDALDNVDGAGLNEESDDLRDIINQLDNDNATLESQLKHVKAELTAMRNAQPKQYESSVWDTMQNTVFPAEMRISDDTKRNPFLAGGDE